MLTGKMSLTWLPHFNHNNNNNTTELCLVFDSNRWLCKLWWRWLLLLVLYQHNYYQIQTATLIINTFYYKWTLANYDLESVQHCNISSLTCPKAPYFHLLNKSHFPSWHSSSILVVLTRPLNCGLIGWVIKCLTSTLKSLHSEEVALIACILPRSRIQGKGCTCVIIFNVFGSNRAKYNCSYDTS